MPLCDQCITLNTSVIKHKQKSSLTGCVNGYKGAYFNTFYIGKCHYVISAITLA